MQVHTQTHAHVCVTSSVSTLSESAVTFEAEIEQTRFFQKIQLYNSHVQWRDLLYLDPDTCQVIQVNLTHD